MNNRKSRSSVTQQQAGDALPALLQERDLSMRQFASRAGVNVSHLSRLVNGKAGRGATGELAIKLARVLELPDDYFPEAREQMVIEAVRSDRDLRDSIYRRLAKR